MSVAPVYEGWERIQARLVTRTAELDEAALGLGAGAGGWPVWAILSHIAMARAYWLCVVLRVPGLETTPFPDPAHDGWEDHLDAPRGREEVIHALQTTWRIVEACLQGWNLEMLGETFERVRGDGSVQLVSRQSVLARLFAHDAFHSGDASQILGSNGRPSLDPWEPAWTQESL